MTTRHDSARKGRRIELRAAGLGLALIGVGIGACNSSPSLPTARPPTPPAPTTPAANVPLNVSFGGRIGCATFPYHCMATLSVLERNADVPEAWRPAPTDPLWAPDYSTSSTADTFDPKPLRGSPAVAPGPHRLVISLLGTYDTPSYAPDGSQAFDLLGRCTADVEVTPDAGGLDVLVTFFPDGVSYRASCTLDVGKP